MSDISRVEELRAMLAEAEREAAAAAERETASTILTDHVREATERLAALVRGADAAGLNAPDLAAIVAAAVQRVAPAAPEHVAAIIAPEPEPTTPRRTRRRPERDMTRLAVGTILTGTLAGVTGRVRYNAPDSWTATTGARGSYPTASRALQAACGNPAGRGRNDEATVNAFVTLVAVSSDDASAVGRRLDAIVNVT